MTKRVAETLANGVRVVVDPMPSLETAAIGVWAHAGSVDEREEEHGVAHLLEHMAFKGTRRRTARAIAEEIEGAGGHLNASTSHQRTGYYARILKEDVRLAMDIIADILSNPLFDEVELAKEQEVVVQEIGEAADTPDDVVFELLMDATWSDHPLARSILGVPTSVRAQTPASLRGFMDRCYSPGDIIVAAAGNIDSASFICLANDYFGDAPARKRRPQRAKPDFKGGARHDGRDIEQTHLALAFPGVSSTHDDFYATRIYADVLGGGMSSRLFQKIREEHGLAYSVYAFADGFEQCGLTGVYLGSDPDQIQKATHLIKKEMEELVRDVTAAEIDRARAMLRSSLMMGLENPAMRIEAAASQTYVFGYVLSPQEIIKRLDAVTQKDIIRCAERALEGPYSIALVGEGEPEELKSVFGH